MHKNLLFPYKKYRNDMAWVSQKSNCGEEEKEKEKKSFWNMILNISSLISDTAWITAVWMKQND